MKPLCDLCNTRHESHQAHIFPRYVVAALATVVANEKPVANAVANKKKRKPGKYKDAAARKKYMAELMRKRRAGLR